MNNEQCRYWLLGAGSGLLGSGDSNCIIKIGYCELKTSLKP